MYPSISNIMPEIIPELMESDKSKASSFMDSGMERSGRCFEYLCTDLNRVIHPGDILPPVNLPFSSKKSTVIIVPKSKTVHFLPLNRYLAAIMAAALSGVIHGSISFFLRMSSFIMTRREQDFSSLSIFRAENCLTLLNISISG